MLVNVTSPLIERLSGRIGAAVTNARAAVRSFDADEEGLSTVEMILLLFIGIVIIVAILTLFWDSIWPRLELVINELFETAENGG
jgi:hypothetical protein